MKKFLLTALALVTVAVVSIVGTVAYLTWDDSDVNVMTVGNVSIVQHELERIEKSESAADKADNFRPFTQGQMLLPATGTDAYGNIPYATDENGNAVMQKLPYGGAMQLWDDDGKNVMDKLVFVENTGNTDAYVRTLVAFEGTSVGGGAEDLIHPCYNGAFWNAETIGTIEVDGVAYTVAEYTYKRDGGAGVGVLKAGETTRPSLLQLYMASWANNEDVAQFGDTYDILVLSQAVQAAGFADATTALDAGFEDVTVESAAKWFADMLASRSVTEVTADNLEQIDFAAGGTYSLRGTFSQAVEINVAGEDVTIDASAANFEGEGVVTIQAPGVAHAYESLKDERKGEITISGVEAQTLNVLAYNNEKVNIVNNKVNAMSVIGGNFALNISGNTVDGNFGEYTDGEGQALEYGISLRITDYELTMTNNTVMDTYSHAIGINGRQGEAASDWGACGANNQIVAFSGNKITVNSTAKTERAALKIWCDQVYGPYATSGQTPTAAAKALMANILADNTNEFTIGDGHTVFNIFDYKTNDGQ